MSVCEIQYVNSLFNIGEPQRILVHTIVDFEKQEPGLPSKMVEERQEILLPAGNYTDSTVLLQAIRDLIPKLQRHKRMTYGEERVDGPAFKIDHVNPSDHRCMISFDTSRVRIEFPPESDLLRRVLGFETPQVKAIDTDGWTAFLELYNTFGYNNQSYEEKTVQAVIRREKGEYEYKFHGKKLINTLLGTQSLFCYCSVADFSFVGDELAQILVSVPIKGTQMQVVSERFSLLHYVPVLTNHFDKISITLATDLGDNAKFSAGKSLVKLHFRPCRPF